MIRGTRRVFEGSPKNTSRVERDVVFAFSREVFTIKNLSKKYGSMLNVVIALSSAVFKAISVRS